MKTATSQNYEASVNALQTEYYNAMQMFRDAGRRMELYKNQFQLASQSFDLMLKKLFNFFIRTYRCSSRTAADARL